jgi:uncharacterized protein (UPF0333 family)
MMISSSNLEYKDSKNIPSQKKLTRTQPENKASAPHNTSVNTEINVVHTGENVCSIWYRKIIYIIT